MFGYTDHGVIGRTMNSIMPADVNGFKNVRVNWNKRYFCKIIYNMR